MAAPASKLGIASQPSSRRAGRPACQKRKRETHESYGGRLFPLQLEHLRVEFGACEKRQDYRRYAELGLTAINRLR